MEMLLYNGHIVQCCKIVLLTQFSGPPIPGFSMKSKKRRILYSFKLKNEDGIFLKSTCRPRWLLFPSFSHLALLQPQPLQHSCETWTKKCNNDIRWCSVMIFALSCCVKEGTPPLKTLKILALPRLVWKVKRAPDRGSHIWKQTWNKIHRPLYDLQKFKIIFKLTLSSKSFCSRSSADFLWLRIILTSDFGSQEIGRRKGKGQIWKFGKLAPMVISDLWLWQQPSSSGVRE